MQQVHESKRMAQQGAGRWRLMLATPPPLPPILLNLCCLAPISAQARMEAEAALATAADLQSRLGELEAATHVSGEDAARLKVRAAAC